MRITEHYDAVVQKTINRVSVGEEGVEYEVFLRFRDDPRSPFPKEIPELVVVMTMNALQRGDRLAGWVTFDSVMPRDRSVDEAVQEELSEMRERRILLVKQFEHAALEA